MAESTAADDTEDDDDVVVVGEAVAAAAEEVLASDDALLLLLLLVVAMTALHCSDGGLFFVDWETERARDRGNRNKHQRRGSALSCRRLTRYSHPIMTHRSTIYKRDKDSTISDVILETPDHSTITAVVLATLGTREGKRPFMIGRAF